MLKFWTEPVKAHPIFSNNPYGIQTVQDAYAHVQSLLASKEKAEHAPASHRHHGQGHHKKHDKPYRSLAASRTVAGGDDNDGYL